MTGLHPRALLNGYPALWNRIRFKRIVNKKPIWLKRGHLQYAPEDSKLANVFSNMAYFTNDIFFTWKKEPALIM